MTDKYWIADGDGFKAWVATAADRDYWVRARGWTEATEPTGVEQVWVRLEGSDSYGRLPAQALPLHEGKGLLASGPPGYEPAPAPEPKSSSSKSATSGDKKE